MSIIYTLWKTNFTACWTVSCTTFFSDTFLGLLQAHHSVRQWNASFTWTFCNTRSQKYHRYSVVRIFTARICTSLSCFSQFSHWFDDIKLICLYFNQSWTSLIQHTLWKCGFLFHISTCLAPRAFLSSKVFTGYSSGILMISRWVTFCGWYYFENYTLKLCFYSSVWNFYTVQLKSILPIPESFYLTFLFFKFLPFNFLSFGHSKWSGALVSASLWLVKFPKVSIWWFIRPIVWVIDVSKGNVEESNWFHDDRQTR